MTNSTINGIASANLIETNEAQTASGMLTASDGGGIVQFVEQTQVAGSSGYGSFSIGADGTWSYTMGSAHDEFVAGQTYVDSVTVKTVDGTQQVLTVTMEGTNDATVISAASLTETNVAQTVVGRLYASDVDSSAAFVAQKNVAGNNGFGSFTIGTDGTWSYTMGGAHDEFVDGKSYTDSITVMTVDGSSQVLSVLINGTNDWAVIGGTSQASLVESNVAETASGVLTATDVDSSNLFDEKTNVPGDKGYGHFNVSADGVWTYTMDSAHNEFAAGTSYTDSIAVSSADGTRQVLSVTITGTNDAPVLSGVKTFFEGGLEDTTYTVSAADLLKGYSDADTGDTLRVSDLSADHATVADNGDGSYTLTPEANYTGELKLSYSVVDGQGGTIAATSTVNLASVNDAPALTIAPAPLAAGTEDTAYTVSAADLLTGYSDADAGDTLRVSGLIADHATVTDNGDGSYTITPEANYNGELKLSYSVVDGDGGATVAQNTVNLASVNDAPALTSAPAILAAGAEDTAYTVIAADLLAGYSDVDGGTLTLGALVVDHATVTDNGDGSFTLAPEANYDGALALTYTILDGQGGRSSATSTVNLVSVNDAPALTSAPATLTVGTEDTAYTVNAADLLAGYSDVDGGTLTVAALVADHATVTDNGDGSFTLAPEANYNGALALTYTILDGQGGMTSATSTVNLASVNDALTGTVSIEGVAAQYQTLIANNTLADADGLGTISYQWLANGEVISGADGSSFTPGQEQVGKEISVIASYTDAMGKLESVRSESSAAVANANDGPAGDVIITALSGATVSDFNNVATSQTLVASNSLVDADGMGDVTYQWQQNLPGTGEWQTYAYGTTFTLSGLAGSYVRVIASYTDAFGTQESVQSASIFVNDLPTGEVTISGNLTQGETLTATNTLQDVNGLGAVSYQWVANGTAIDGENGSSLTLTQDQVGAEISVIATYTDSSGTLEGVGSAPSVQVANVNDAPTGTVSISGIAEQNQTLTASNTLADTDGLGVISYQWLANGEVISGANDSSLTLTQEQVGKQISVKASYTDQWGTAESVVSTSSAAVANVNDAPTGTVSISGTAAQNQTLVAGNTLSDADGLGTKTISYQWLANGEVISGATDASFTLTQDQVGQEISVLATYTDSTGIEEAVESARSVQVANVNDATTGVVSISGVAEQNQTLTASNTLADTDGLGAISYQWLANGEVISGANDSSLTLTQEQVGKQISVKASYTDQWGTAESVVSTSSAAVANVNDAPTGVVSISGNAEQNQTLTVSNSLADKDGLGAISYQWLANGEVISGATGASLILTQDQVGKQISVKASYTDPLGAAESVVSTPSAAVANVNDALSGSVSLDGTLAQGGTLVANVSGLVDPDGFGPLHYRWESQSAAGQWTTIDGAESNTLALTSNLGNQKIHVIVSYTDNFGTAESVTSAASNPFKAANWTNSTPTGGIALAGYTMVGQTLKATFNLADADWMTGPVSYHWQMSNSGSKGWSNIAGATTDSLSLTLAQQGKYVRFVADYTDGFGTHEVVTSATTAKIAHVNYVPKFVRSAVSYKVSENSTAVGQAYAVNTDPGDTVTYSVVGTNAELFEVVNGVLRFKAAPDFESAASQAAKNHYVVDLVATDALGLSAKQTVSISVLNVNEAPTWAQASRTVFAKDGLAFVDNVRGAHLIDQDSTDNFLSSSTPALTLGGADAGLFTTTRTGKLSFTKAAVKGHALSAQGDQSYQLELIATDKGGLSTDTQELIVKTVDILGTVDNDTLVGTAGNERMAGIGGSDRLTGGAGADTFYVSEGQDSITDLGNGADVLNVAAEAQVVAQVTANWTASAQTVNLGKATLMASASVDLSAVTSGNGFVIEAVAANLTLKGSQGADTFVLKAGIVETVLGFESGKDTICFKGLNGLDLNLTGSTGGSGAMAVISKAFAAGADLSAAANPDQHLILNTTTGDLYFDADGSGDNATATLLAHFSPAALPTWADMRVDSVFGIM